MKIIFFIFFIILFLVAIWIIWRTWSRYTHYSTGYYKDGGQDVILWCEKSRDEITNSLCQKDDNDTIRYDFYVDNNMYFLKVRGVRRWQEESLYKAIFRIEFFTRENGTYIVVKRTQRIYSCAFEAELYEFFVKKLKCIARKEVL